MPVSFNQTPRFRLRTILLLVNLFVLIIPLGGIYFFRIYENELVRQTETELIAQGVYISELYKKELLPTVGAEYGASIAKKVKQPDSKYQPILPTLDLVSKKVNPPRPDASQTTIKAEPMALVAGSKVFPIIEEATYITLAGVRLTDYQGIVVAGRDEVGLSLANVEETQKALAGQYMAVLRQRISKNIAPELTSLSRGTGIRVFVSMPIIHNNRVIGTILLSRSPRSILKGLYDGRYSVMVAGSIILAMTVLMALLTSYTISRPIHALINQAQRVARGEKDVGPIKEPVTKELALLSENITLMAKTIQERSDYIRNFAMHVSHEFKTPLTAIQGATELIQEHGTTMPPEQFARFLYNITTDAERLNKLVTRLLEMARADVTLPRQEKSEFNFIMKELQSRYQDSNFKIINSQTEATLPIPEDIIITILGNLIENSRQHGATEVVISVEKDVSKIKVIIADNGHGISKANIDKLFTPFFTTKRDQGGTGLGLIIVRALLTAYKADIKSMSKKAGAHFIIIFP